MQLLIKFIFLINACRYNLWKVDSSRKPLLSRHICYTTKSSSNHCFALRKEKRIGIKNYVTLYITQIHPSIFTYELSWGSALFLVLLISVKKEYPLWFVPIIYFFSTMTVIFASCCSKSILVLSDLTYLCYF